MNILFVSAYTPSRIRVRPYSFIKALARRGHAITLVCGAGRSDVAALSELRAICRKVEPVPQGKLEMAWNALRALPGDLPLQAALSFGAAMVDAVRAELHANHFDVAHVEHLRAAALGYALQSVPAVLDGVDCISLLFERALRGSPSPKSRLMALADLARTRRYEAGYTARYERVLVSSPEDAWALRTLMAGAGRPADEAAAIHVVPNGVDLAYFAPQPLEREPNTLVFSGKMSYHANEAAALFLAGEIMPLVWRERPDVRLLIAGSSPTRAVRDLGADRRITVTGFVEDLREPLARASVAVAPLRYGVGIQNKVLEAMATATPVVATPQATQALAPEARAALLQANSPSAFAQAVLELLEQPQRRQQLGEAGRTYVETHHSWLNNANRLVERYAQA